MSFGDVDANVGDSDNRPIAHVNTGEFGKLLNYFRFSTVQHLSAVSSASILVL